MKMRNLFVAMSVMLVMAFAVNSGYAQQPEKAVAVFNVQPEMHCQNCENKIKTNLRFEKGVKDVQTDIKAKTVTVEYDTRKTDPDKIKEAFTKIGYNASEVCQETNE